MSLPGRLRCLVATVLVAAGLAVLPAAEATATAAPRCGPGHGVVVLVDFGRLHHPDVRTCIPDGGGRDAARILGEAGLSLTDVQRQPGFVCRVDGLPSDDPCVNTPPADAYWALWWSDGRTGTWAYSTVMASALEVPAGGSVAMVWHEGGPDVPPQASPVAGAGITASPVAKSARAAAADRPAPARSGGLPSWVAIAGIGLLFAAAAGAAVVRRRRGVSGP